ncbi:hypothetical protein C2S52_013829 [Perilla frutescens var. hirtella]|nr:hypothetical protein C2S51_016091 [Perilla frutescens var. frutescens]KAH6776268.1 hypothetical protein C2S52_013829 [Perilla frutescens var. hirtella]
MASNSTSPHHYGNPSIKYTPKEGKMMIPPKDLNIVWGNDNRYWTVPKKEDENVGAELHQVSWLEVTGLVDETRANKRYEVGFGVSLNPDAFGWGNYPIYIMIKRGRQGKTTWTKISINPNQKGEFQIKARSNYQQPQNDPKLYFGLYEVWSAKWKGGLNFHHAYITELP